MEKISKVGKNFETVFEEILTENNLTQEEVIYKTTEIKKGLFKSANVEVTIYKKSDIYDFVKEFLKEIVNNLGLEVTFETKKVEDRVVIKMYSNNNNILIGHNGNTIKALENLVRQKIQLETGMFYDRNWPAFITLLHYGRNEFAKFIVDTNPFAPERINKIMGRPIDNQRSLNAAKGLELNLMLTAKKKGFWMDELSQWYEELSEDRDELLESDPFRKEAIPLYQVITNY